MELQLCMQCPRLSRAVDEAIECTPPPSERCSRDALVARLGQDARVGDAMGSRAVALHADVAVEIVGRVLEENGALVAVVVDRDGRLVGLLDAAETVRAAVNVRAGKLARWIGPVHEAAPLDHAVDRMVRERARALPVVDDGGCVVALLTDLDALRWVARRSVSVE